MKRIEKDNAVFTYFRPQRRPGLRGLVKAWAVNSFYTMLVRTDPPKRNLKRKYHISLCTMFKDEAPYFKEWIEFHRIVGADHFYLYDNNSSDDFEAVLAPYIEKGIVTLIHWPEEHAQTKGFEDCIKRFRGESDWIGFIDVDEFLVPVEEESLVTFLDRFARRPAVLVYWRFFGSGGRLTRDVSRLVTEDFVVASGKLYDKGKCFFNSNYDYYWNYAGNGSMFHYLWTVSRGRAIPPVDMFDRTTLRKWCPAPRTRKIPVQLNHYAVKSLAEHREKDKKGDVFYDHPTHGDDVFFMRERRCSVPDYRIFKYITELKIRMKGPENEKPADL